MSPLTQTESPQTVPSLRIYHIYVYWTKKANCTPNKCWNKAYCSSYPADHTSIGAIIVHNLNICPRKCTQIICVTWPKEIVLHCSGYPVYHITVRAVMMHKPESLPHKTLLPFTITLPNILRKQRQFGTNFLHT